MVDIILSPENAQYNEIRKIIERAHQMDKLSMMVAEKLRELTLLMDQMTAHREEMLARSKENEVLPDNGGNSST